MNSPSQPKTLLLLFVKILHVGSIVFDAYPRLLKHILSDQLSAEQEKMVGNRSHWDIMKSLKVSCSKAVL